MFNRFSWLDVLNRSPSHDPGQPTQNRPAHPCMRREAAISATRSARTAGAAGHARPCQATSSPAHPAPCSPTCPHHLYSHPPRRWSRSPPPQTTPQAHFHPRSAHFECTRIHHRHGDHARGVHPDPGTFGPSGPRRRSSAHPHGPRPSSHLARTTPPRRASNSSSPAHAPPRPSPAPSRGIGIAACPYRLSPHARPQRYPRFAHRARLYRAVRV